VFSGLAAMAFSSFMV